MRKPTGRMQLLLVLVVVTLVLGSSVSALADEPIKIGLITPITGALSSYGQSVRDAAVLGVDYLNEQGGLLGRPINLIVMDDSGDPTESANAARRLIDRDEVSLIIGPVITPCVLAVAPIAQQNQIPMITPTGTGDTITDIGDYIFRACYKDSFQGQVMARFARENLGVETAAIIYDVANDYSTGLMNAFRDEFSNLGGSIVSVQSYTGDDVDFSAQLTAIARQAPDAMFVPDYHPQAGPIAMQARQIGIASTFLGVDGWDSPDLPALAGGAEEGAYIVNHYAVEDESPSTQAFIESYRERYGATPDALAALAYDAVLIVAEALNIAGSLEPEAIRDGLGQAENVQAATGTINMDPEGTPVKAVVILQMQDGQAVLVDKIEPE